MTRRCSIAVCWLVMTLALHYKVKLARSNLSVPPQHEGSKTPDRTIVTALRLAEFSTILAA